MDLEMEIIQEVQSNRKTGAALFPWKAFGPF
jgi:hypothetical protein